VLNRVGAAAAITCVLAAGCVAHPVGPARTFDDYRRKAVTTAESALSAVESARLVADAASDGNAFGPYTAAVIDESEGAATAVQGTFDSIQPPDADADDLRDELDELLSSASDHLADLRIEARRNELDTLADVAAPLADDASALRDFIEAHG
jgi:hypothetical protein